MSSSTLTVQDCASQPGGDRCDAVLPDNPQCALHYHFGQLLGVDDFRAEQGFHLGRSRRHQRLLHGAGVVAGYPLSYKSALTELRVGPGLAVDDLGRDLLLDTDQCISLARWWQARLTTKDSDFSDLFGQNDFEVDLDLTICYATCLSEPVPAIAEPCAGAASDIAYARVCETVRLQLVRYRPPAASPAPATPAVLPDGRDALVEALAQASVAPPDDSDPALLCLRLARLHKVHFKFDGQTWQVDLPSAQIDLQVRRILLSTTALQSLLRPDLDTPPPVTGPQVLASQAQASGTTVTLPFDQKLAAKSVLPASFTVTQFDPASGWRTLAIQQADYTESTTQPALVTLTLTTTLTGGLPARIGVIGEGPTPLLGANLIPAGASRFDRDGRSLTITIH